MRPTPANLYIMALKAYSAYFSDPDAQLLAVAEAGYRVSMLQKLGSIEETAQALEVDPHTYAQAVAKSHRQHQEQNPDLAARGRDAFLEIWKTKRQD